MVRQPTKEFVEARVQLQVQLGKEQRGKANAIRLNRYESTFGGRGMASGWRPLHAPTLPQPSGEHIRRRLNSLNLAVQDALPTKMQLNGTPASPRPLTHAASDETSVRSNGSCASTIRPHRSVSTPDPNTKSRAAAPPKAKATAPPHATQSVAGHYGPASHYTRATSGAAKNTHVRTVHRQGFRHLVRHKLEALDHTTAELAARAAEAIVRPQVNNIFGALRLTLIDEKYMPSSIIQARAARPLGGLHTLSRTPRRPLSTPGDRGRARRAERRDRAPHQRCRRARRLDAALALV